MPASFTASLPPEVPFPEPSPRSPAPESTSVPIPVVYETAELDKMSLQAYAAIHLRVPDSGIDWLDRMIRRSRELDQHAPAK
jgi:hypothetical protein